MGHVARTGVRRGVYRILVGKPEGKGPLVKPTRRKGENNIKINLQIVGYGGMNWIDLVQKKHSWRDTCQCGNDPSGSYNAGYFLNS